MKKIKLILVAAVVLMSASFIVNNVVAVNTRISEVSARSAIKIGEYSLLYPNTVLYDQLKIKALSNMGKEGWFYIRDHVQYDVDAPTEKDVLPLVNSRSESWWYINSSGMVEKSISVERTEDGQIIQVGMFSNGTAWNTTVDEIIPTEPYIFVPDYGLAYHMKFPDLKSEKIDKDGKESIQFKITHVEKQPLKTLDYLKKLLSMEFEFVFDNATGFIVSVMQIANLEDGSRRVSSVLIEEIRIGYEPPSNVLEYFTQKDNREAQP